MVKSVIKKLGMEKEFSNWVKYVKTRPVLREGVRVRVKEGTTYGITVPGSEGIIKGLPGSDYLSVEFYKIPGGYFIDTLFTIRKKDVEII